MFSLSDFYQTEAQVLILSEDRCTTICVNLIIVTASYEWDEPPLLRTMNPPISQSVERLFEENTEGDGFIIIHRIEDTEEGDTRKVQVDRELYEYVLSLSVWYSCAQESSR